MGKRVVLFGASGMVGWGILLECLDSDKIESVIMVNRRSIGIKHEKLKEVLHDDFLNYDPIRQELINLDACFWPLGVSAVGLSEAEYTKITYEYAIAGAQVMKELNPNMVFCYVSGVGTDSTEKGRTMWARVKGRTENKLMAMFDKAYMFRPGYIQPKRGVKSRTGWYNAMYLIFSWMYPIFKAVVPNSVTDTVRVGKAMIACLNTTPEKQILHAKEINSLSLSA